MSEENETQEGGLSAMKKTLIGIATTAVTAAGAYVTTHIEAIFGGGEEKEEVAAPAPAPAPVINLNVDNSSQNNSSNNGGGTTTIIKEKIIEKSAPAQPAAPAKKSETEDSPW